MKTALKIAAGATSGALIAAVTTPWLARTAAIAMPRGFNLSLWEAVVVFGLGATLVALPVMLLALRLTRARGADVAWMLGAALLALVGWLAAQDVLATGAQVLTAWAVGLALAALLHRLWRRPRSEPQQAAA